MNIDNIEGQSFASISVIFDSDKSRLQTRLCDCVCRCGKLFTATAQKLKSGRIKTCGCKIRDKNIFRLIGTKTKAGCEVLRLVSGQKYVDRVWRLKCPKCNYEFDREEQNIKTGGRCYQCTNLIGKTFGYWTVISVYKSAQKYSNKFYKCLCKCGNLKKLSISSLTSGDSKSCGCKRYESKIKIRRQRTRSFHPPIWKSMVKYIKKRHDNQCYICESPQKLAIHHLDSWKDFPLVRYEETNLVCLCNFCHNDFHSKYGRDSIVKEMFFEYISGFKYQDEFLDEVYSYKIKNGFIHKQQNNFIRSTL